MEPDKQPSRRMMDMGPRRSMDMGPRRSPVQPPQHQPASRPAHTRPVQAAQPLPARPVPQARPVAPAPSRPAPMPARPMNVRPAGPAMLRRQVPADEPRQASVKEAKTGGWRTALQVIIGLVVIAAVASAIVVLYIRYYSN